MTRKSSAAPPKPKFSGKTRTLIAEVQRSVYIRRDEVAKVDIEVPVEIDDDAALDIINYDYDGDIRDDLSEYDLDWETRNEDETDVDLDELRASPTGKDPLPRMTSRDKVNLLDLLGEAIVAGYLRGDADEKGAAQAGPPLCSCCGRPIPAADSDDY